MVRARFESCVETARLVEHEFAGLIVAWLKA
jgi:hypothetical protein